MLAPFAPQHKRQANVSLNGKLDHNFRSRHPSQSLSSSAIDATRSLTSTEATNGFTVTVTVAVTVTVTVSANFESSVDGAKLVDIISGGGIFADSLYS
ncbi:MAG: hypothetical protein J07HQX50_01620 [Haloquadratum sp. J07HQX50]|nr:MAG: hypothetical protein J07HQX50_01620 [Haloquadratum sp. J07HQX50]